MRQKVGTNDEVRKTKNYSQYAVVWIGIALVPIQIRI
jgi:hypothetical protein